MMIPRIIACSTLSITRRAALKVTQRLIPRVQPWRSPSSLTARRFQSQSLGQIKVDKPQLMIAFTCKKCDTRSSHVMSKQAYTSGTVLIACPGCKNRHLIADHLKIFSDDRVTIEDILSAKGESVSQDTDDLVFDEIPDKLKGLIGHHAKDSPANMAKDDTQKEPHSLPEGKE